MTKRFSGALTSVLLAGLLLSGCGSFTNTMTVGLPYAKTSGNNYINSGVHNFGSLFVWDVVAETLSRIAIVDKSHLADPITAANIDQGLSRGFKLTFTGVPPKLQADPSFQASVTSAINRESAIALENVRTQRYKHGPRILNQKETVALRQEIVADYADRREEVRFVFIEGQLLADSASFRVARSSDNKMVIQAPGSGTLTLVADYSGVNAETYKGGNVPVLLEVAILKLVPSPETVENGTGYRFRHDTTNANAVLSSLLRGDAKGKTSRFE